mgnify:CR=1
YWLGMILGFTADVISFLIRKNLPVSSMRVKKFASTTEFRSGKDNLSNFNAPFSLIEGIRKTLHSEFIAPDPQREVFYTE